VKIGKKWINKTIPFHWFVVDGIELVADALNEIAAKGLKIVSYDVEITHTRTILIVQIEV
jgi:hypothetical protein